MNFSLEMQQLLIEYMLADETVFQRCNNILKPEYFEKELIPVMACILSHADKYNSIPTPDQIVAETGAKVRLVPNVRDQDQRWALDTIEKFCQQGAIIEAVDKSVDYIQEGNRDIVEELVREACLVGLQKDLGTDYFKDPKARLEKIVQKNLIPTGLEAIDKKLYGGLNRGEITIFAGSSGMGKSLFLQNLCLNWVLGVEYEYKGVVRKYDPMDVVYLTLELSEELTSKRLDTMLTGIPSQDVIKQMDTVELKVRTIGKKAGNLTVKYLPGDQTTNSNAIRAYLKEYEIQKGKLPDCIAVDYLDELDTNRGNISASDMFTKDKFVTSELRQLAVDLDIVLVTASQLNRSAVDEGEHSQAMMGGGLSKVQKADNVISIYASASMKERDEFQCQFLKTRSSAGVDSKVFLGFDKNKLRLYNLDREPGEDNDSSTAVKKPTISSNDALIKSIKKGPTKKTVQEHINPETGEVTDVAHPKPAVGDESPMEKLKRLKKEGMV